MKEKLAQVTSLEGNEIKVIYSHLSSLKELDYLIKSCNKEIYDKFVKDLEDTNNAYQQWWDKISIKYNLPVHEQRNWEFNFRTNTICLL